MKLGCIASKRVYRIERYTQRFFRNRRHRPLFRKGRAVFVISGKFIESPGPAIALGFNRPLEDRERFRLIIRRLIFDGSGKQGNALESSLLGKKSPDLNIRIDSGF